MRIGLVVHFQDGTVKEVMTNTFEDAAKAEAAAKATEELAKPVSVVYSYVEPVMWQNCLYGGRAVGHSYGFCTANACY